MIRADGSELLLHKLLLSPDEAQLQLVASCPTPKPRASVMQTSAQWAPDDSAVLLLYTKLTEQQKPGDQFSYYWPSLTVRCGSDKSMAC